MHRLVAWLVRLVVCASTIGWMQGNSSEEVLAGKGLRRLTSCFALADEAELTKNLRQAEVLKRDLLDAQKEMTQRKKFVDDKQKLLVRYMEQRQQLRQQLSEVRNIETHNRVVAALNEVGDRLVLLHESKVEEQALQAAMTKVSQLTEQYIDQLLKTRELYDKAVAKYQQLANDTSVKQALDSYNNDSQRSYSLGPSPTFLSNGRKLAKLEESVLSDKIELRRGPGGLWHVTAVFGGSRPTDMAVDTGASLTVLPARIAQEVGVKAKEDAPTVRLQTADGRVMAGKLVVVDKIRVGRFTVENVECAVMPSQMGDALPLLGLSFFKHFNFKIDNAAARLTLARVDSSENGRPGR